jgi:hypothetical protein
MHPIDIPRDDEDEVLTSSEPVIEPADEIDPSEAADLITSRLRWLGMELDKIYGAATAKDTAPTFAIGTEEGRRNIALRTISNFFNPEIDTADAFTDALGWINHVYNEAGLYQLSKDREAVKTYMTKQAAEIGKSFHLEKA